MKLQEKDFSLFLDLLSGTTYHIPQKSTVFHNFLKRNLRPIYLKFVCAEVQKFVLVPVCIIKEVCLFVCLSVYLPVYLLICLPVCLSVCLSI